MSAAATPSHSLSPADLHELERLTQVGHAQESSAVSDSGPAVALGAFMTALSDELRSHQLNEDLLHPATSTQRYSRMLELCRLLKSDGPRLQLARIYLIQCRYSCCQNPPFVGVTAWPAEPYAQNVLESDGMMPVLESLEHMQLSQQDMQGSQQDMQWSQQGLNQSQQTSFGSQMQQPSFKAGGPQQQQQHYGTGAVFRAAASCGAIQLTTASGKKATARQKGAATLANCQSDDISEAEEEEEEEPSGEQLAGALTGRWRMAKAEDEERKRAREAAPEQDQSSTSYTLANMEFRNMLRRNREAGEARRDAAAAAAQRREAEEEEAAGAAAAQDSKDKSLKQTRENTGH